MRVNAAILTDESAASPQARADLQAEFDEIVLGNAYEGIASRTETGEYFLLRGRDVPSSALLKKLGAAAEHHAIPQARFGLETNSLQLSSFGAGINPVGLRQAVDNLRQADRPVQEWEGVVMRQPFRQRPVALAAASVAVVAIGWLMI